MTTGQPQCNGPLCLHDAALASTLLSLQDASPKFAPLSLQEALLCFCFSSGIWTTTWLQVSMLPVAPGTHGQLDEVSSTALDGAVHGLPVSFRPCLLCTQPPTRQSLDGPASSPQGDDEPPCPGCFLCLLHKALHLHHQCMHAVGSPCCPSIDEAHTCSWQWCHPSRPRML